MSCRRFSWILTTTLSLLSFVTAWGQAVQTSAVAGPVKLNVEVTPHKDGGKPVGGLAQSSFTVLDNGAPQAIQKFRFVSAPAERVKVLIVLDAVNLDFQRVAYERQELDKLLQKNDGQLAQPTALAIFTDHGVKLQPGFSTDGHTLSAALADQVIGLRDLRRSSGFFGAEERLDMSLKAADQLLAYAAKEPGRKLILWLTPGWPLLSGPGVQLSSREQDRLFHQVVAFSAAIRRANTTMYVIDPLGAAENPARTFYYENFLKGLRKPSQADIADLGAQVLAVQSGGLFLSGSNDLAGLLQQCYADASAFYEISYQPPPAEQPNEYHQIEVRMAEPELKARTLQGYYAQP